MKRFTVLILACIFLMMVAAGCSSGKGGRSVLSSCEYTETGRTDGSYLSVSVMRSGKEASLGFRASAGTDSKQLTAEIPVQTEVLDRVAETAERWSMKDWAGGTGTVNTADGVIALRMTYDDGTRLYISTADDLPSGGPAALEEVRETLFTALTPDGLSAFGGQEAPIDLSVLAEPEPAADGWKSELSPEGQTTVNVLREEIMDDGSVYAIAFLGSPDTSGGGVASDRGYLTLMLQAEGYENLTFLAELPSDRFVELPEGRTLYLILTLDPSAVIEVYRGTEDQREALLFRGDGALPLLLRCGAEVTEEDVLVVVSASDGSMTEFSPRLTEEGTVAPVMRGFDCSAYNRAVG